MKALNNGVLATAHKLPLCNPLRTLLHYRVKPVGRSRPLTLDERETMMNLESTDLTVMGTTLAGALELVPCSDAIALEAPDSPYAQVVAVHEADSHRPEFLQLRAICQSEQLLRFVQEKTGGEALPAFVEK